MLRKLEIVLVDDEDQITTLLEAYIQLAIRDTRIHTFNDPIAAKEFIKRNQVDVLITDYKMPHLNGIQLAESVPAHVCKVIISGYTSVITDEKLQKLNATFFMKPVPLRSLTKIISEQQEKVCHAS